MEALIKNAEILIDALPYIQKLNGKTVVIKYGGNAMISGELKNSVMEDITLLKFIGVNPVVVHGGGPDITSYMHKLGLTPEFINGLRVTDGTTVEIAQMVLVGKTNKEISEALGLSDNTVKHYLGNVFEKLQVKRRSQAAAFFTQNTAGQGK